MADPERFELPTNWFEASYSIQLSYGSVRRRVAEPTGLGKYPLVALLRKRKQGHRVTLPLCKELHVSIMGGSRSLLLWF
jgi:hypothetical protein